MVQFAIQLHRNDGKDEERGPRQGALGFFHKNLCGGADIITPGSEIRKLRQGWDLGVDMGQQRPLQGDRHIIKCFKKQGSHY